MLDENLPKRLKDILSPHSVFTVRDMGWNGITNGALLKLMIENRFDAFLTFDKNLRYQQNFKKYQIPVIVFNAPDNSFHTLSGLTNVVLKLLESELPSGPHEVK